MKKIFICLLVLVSTIALVLCTVSKPEETGQVNPIPSETTSYIKPVVETPEVTPEPVPTYTQEELEIMAIIIYQEHGGNASSDETRIKIGNVVMNRVTSDAFPDTIKEVALQSGQWGTLSITGIKWADRASKPEEAEAVQRAYDCAKRVLEGKTLLPENVIWAAEFKQGKDTSEYVDGTYFCY